MTNQHSHVLKAIFIHIKTGKHTEQAPYSEYIT